MRMIALGLLAVMLAACSTVETTRGAVPLSSLQNGAEHFQLRVNTGDARRDQLVYEFAFEQFSQVLPIAEHEPYTGTLDITFTSETQGAFVGSSSTVGQAQVSTSGWYTGGGYTGQGYASGSSTTVSSGTMLEWQNSTMIAVLRRTNGERLWSGDYEYRGGWELSGWVVNTPEQAARLVTQRLREQFARDAAH